VAHASSGFSAIKLTPNRSVPNNPVIGNLDTCHYNLLFAVIVRAA
jgi:hypothetical protein